MVPTRELCLQVTEDLATAAKYLTADGGRKLTVVSIYGGRPYEPQIEALQTGVDVVVGTPGRLLDLAQQGHLQLGGLSVLVLDEADEMLDLGFLPDIERILRQIPDERQAMLFSATMPDPIITLARTFMNQPTHIRAEAPHSSATHDTHRAVRLPRARAGQGRNGQPRAAGRGPRRDDDLHPHQAHRPEGRRRARGARASRSAPCTAISGQIAREKALKAFRTGEVDVLVATDVAARGIDIDDITHVINYQIPEDEQAYVHRIGRTGRAGKTGIAVTLVDWDELPRWTMIDKALGLNCPDPVETYSNSPHLYAELDIPTDASGTVGAARKSPVKRRENDSAGRTDRTSADGPKPARNRTGNRRRTRGGQAVTGHVAGTAPRAPTVTPPPRRRRPPHPVTGGPTAVAAVVAIRAKPLPPPRLPTESALAHGQTRTPHQGRPGGRRGDRGGRRRRGRTDLVDQRRPSHHQPPVRGARARP